MRKGDGSRGGGSSSGGRGGGLLSDGGGRGVGGGADLWELMRRMKNEGEGKSRKGEVWIFFWFRSLAATSDVFSFARRRLFSSPAPLQLCPAYRPGLAHPRHLPSDDRLPPHLAGSRKRPPLRRTRRWKRSDHSVGKNEMVCRCSGRRRFDFALAPFPPSFVFNSPTGTRARSIARSCAKSKCREAFRRWNAAKRKRGV